MGALPKLLVDENSPYPRTNPLSSTRRNMNTNYPTDVPKLLTRAIAFRFPVHSHTSVHHARLSPESPRGTRLMYSANWPALIVSQNRARRCGVSDAREWTPRRRKLHVTGRAETRLFSWKVCCRFAQPVTLTRLTPLHPFPSFPRDVDGPHRYHLQTPRSTTFCWTTTTSVCRV